MTELTLSTACGECGASVAVEVPKWLLAAMEKTTNGPAETDGLGEGRRRRMDSDERSREKRGGVVGAVVGVAQLLKASPLPNMVVSLVQTVFAFILYLDACFSLHQRLALILATFFEGLVEIEREVGIMKNAGDWMSIGWEATVKGIIAFARADSPSYPSAQPVPSHPPRHGRSRTQHDRQDYSSSYESEAGYSNHHGGGSFPVTSPGLHLELPSNERSNLRHTLNATPSSSRTTTDQPSSEFRPHRRTPHSSPTLQSAYLASLPVSPPTDSPSFSLSSSPSDSSLPPYYHDRDRERLSFAPSHLSMQPARHPHPPRPRITRQRSVSGPDTSPARPEMGVRGSSWAGKAVIGLAERMKVL